MKRILAVMCTATLGACTSATTLSENLPKYVGQPIDRIVERIGLPNGLSFVDGRKSYLWSTNAKGTVVVPSASATHSGPSTTIDLPTNAALSCLLRIFVDRTDTVRGFQYIGYNLHCQPYALKLEQR